MIDEVKVCTHIVAQTQHTVHTNSSPAAHGPSSHFQRSYVVLGLGELNTHTRTGLFICLPFRILLRIITINRFALMRLSDAENCQSKQCTIYWEIRWRFSEGGHNNAEEVSDEFSILEN